MADASSAVELSGSHRFPARGARRLGVAEMSTPASVTVLLRSPTDAPPPPPLDTLARTRPTHRPRLLRAHFAAVHGADPQDVRRVGEFAETSGLRLVSVERGARTMHLSGTVGDLARAFGTRLHRYAGPRGSYRGREGPLLIPRSLRGVILGVFGLDDRPQASTPLRPRPPRAAGAPSYTPVQVAAAYDFPTPQDGTGQTIGLIELGGGFRTSDLQSYFSSLGLPVPSITAVEVDGATNAPTGSPTGPDGEVTLDVEVAGAVAPGAQLVAYFAPNTDQGFLDAVTSAIHDATYRPSVVSISWGGPENSWTEQARNALASAIEDAAQLGVTIVVAAGDNGAADGGPRGSLEVDFPASAPGAIGCGGTTLVLAGTAIRSEKTWNELTYGEGATGGGVSEAFPEPSFQANSGVPAAPNGFLGRGVPDVAGDADPATGYNVLVDGQAFVLGGTSAVAPLWAGLIARINQALGAPVGFVTPELYASAASFHDITIGGNGGYNAGPGWDACTGLGTPDGAELLAALKRLGSPESPS